MKLFKSLILALALIIGNSCTLDLLEDPNNVQMDGARATLLLNSIQRSTAAMFQGTSTFGMQMTRLQNSGGVNYFNVFGPQTFDGTWQTAYAGILQDAKTVTAFADANGWARHAGIARVLSAYALLQLVDLFGDIPYSEALQDFANLNPKVDNQASLYTEAIAMLDQAELDLKTASTAAVPAGYLNPLAEVPTDSYYANTYTSWIRLINSLKLKIYLNLRLTDAAAATAGINAAIADPDGLIVNQNHNFVFRYSSNLSDPDSRHPRFVANYPGGGGNYMSNYIMWQMFHGYDAKQQNGDPGDPRMRFYFYRQTTTNNTDPNNIRCVTATSIPAHYPAKVGSAIVYGVAGIPPGISIDPNNAAWSTTTTGTLSRTFCYPTDRGYWGRDHVDNQGIPPDGLLRTAWGVYPAGGRFDTNQGQSVNATTRGGMFGAGIQPMVTRSFVQFMLAEAALYLGTTGTARTHFENGIRNSMADVRDWAVNGTYGVGTAAATEATSINTFYPTAFAGTFTTPVRAATTANIASLSGQLIIDGVVDVNGVSLLTDGDRVLVKNQTTQSENGIYTVVTLGPWIRATTSDTGPELLSQAVFVQEGVANGRTNWRQTTTGTITVGTSNIVWGYNNNFNYDVDEYVIKALAKYDAQVGNDNIMNYIAREYWVSAFGNGVEAYNLYRRTGMPTGMQPTIQPGPGSFPRSFFYPQVFATLNNTVEQKSDLTVRVFWDNNASNLDF